MIIIIIMVPLTVLSEALFVPDEIFPLVIIWKCVIYVGILKTLIKTVWVFDLFGGFSCLLIWHPSPPNTTLYSYLYCLSTCRCQRCQSLKGSTWGRQWRQLKVGVGSPAAAPISGSTAHQVLNRAAAASVCPPVVCGRCRPHQQIKDSYSLVLMLTHITALFRHTPFFRFTRFTHYS